MDPALFLIAMLLLFVGGMAVAIILNARKSAREAEERAYNKLKAAKSALDQSMSRLMDDPTNPELRQRALAVGRAYASLTRDEPGVTLYDEMALKNDLDAACAGALGRPAEADEASSLGDDLQTPAAPVATDNTGIEITLSCGCGAKMTVSSRLGGRSLKCPQCDGQIRVPKLA